MLLRPTAVIACVLLSGCASTPCDDPLSDACRDAQLLQQNDMLQARLLVASGELDQHPLANALLDRAAKQDTRGETAFYQAILKVREGPQVDDVLNLLQESAEHDHPYAIALLYKIYSEPYLVEEDDPVRAETYRATYAELDVAKSGYPSLTQALQVVDGLLSAPQQ